MKGRQVAARATALPIVVFFATQQPAAVQGCGTADCCVAALRHWGGLTAGDSNKPHNLHYSENIIRTIEGTR